MIVSLVAFFFAFTMGNDAYLLESTINTDTNQQQQVAGDTVERKPIVTTPSNAPNASIPFTLSLSPLIVDFGRLSPTEPVTRTTTLTVSHGAAYDYTVHAVEEHALSSTTSGNTIPDTSCDNGSCTEQIASLWHNILSYGFGYRCDNLFGEDCDPGFLQPEFFKQFPNAALSEPPETIMASSTWGRIKKTTITFKVNVAKAQKEDVYRNTVTLIAIPNF